METQKETQAIQYLETLIPNLSKELYITALTYGNLNYFQNHKHSINYITYHDIFRERAMSYLNRHKRNYNKYYPIPIQDRVDKP